ncbi:probable sulfite oxidase, mitochondrial [Ctenocephalides felis]|uniref:probable sulfite oxidase, mitochondrial n=1 Tax=Ctenocephalides felis TaxID=7515 RepID=UPI000E6E4BA3|nr:probable sulfite oxidase, mitochondrial [Ctenocephalides felis]
MNCRFPQIIRNTLKIRGTSTRYICLSQAHFQNHSQSNHENCSSWHSHKVFSLLGIVAAAYAGYKYTSEKKLLHVHAESANELGVQKVAVGEPRPDLPFYSMDDVTKHASMETGIWVTYRLGVYDITNFVAEHPGSDIINLAAGGSVEPFWNIYQQHNNPQVWALLETLRIGNLNPDDQADTSDLHDPWSTEPKRHPVLKAASQKPFNAEPPLKLLCDSFFTPNEMFYVRNHLPVPDINVEDYELDISVEIACDKSVTKEATFKLDDIKKLPKYSVSAAIMCGGNRRSEMTKVKDVRGLTWGAAAVGNATWSGARLVDVLESMGIKSDEESHVQFIGLDADPTNTTYGASVPLSHVMNPRNDVLLAYEMNGKPLNRDHGFPLRVIIPGVIGARNVKWLGSIVISSEESDSHWQQNDYKGFSPSTDWDTVDFTKSPAIQAMPVTSAICLPQENEKVKPENGFIKVKGYAWSGGGQRIVRVDVTGDQGLTWTTAKLEQGKEPSSRHYGWTLWTADVPVQKGVKEMELWSKAVDSNYNVQPESFANIWNLRGVLSNAYHKVKINIK